MAELLYIVSRRQPALYERVRREFNDAPGVEVLLDRRRGDRRRQSQIVTAERRHAEQRARDIDGDLETLGGAIVCSGHHASI